MRLALTLLALAAAVGLVPAHPQAPTPATAPPPLPPPPSSSSAPPPGPAPPASAASKEPAPAPAQTEGAGPPGPICECGYTYCASVLMSMRKPWSQKQLAEAYCKTPDAGCANGTPDTDVRAALYLCLCDSLNARQGNKLHLMCGCDECLVVPPDFRGRCRKPCHVCEGKTAKGGGG